METVFTVLIIFLYIIWFLAKFVFSDDEFNRMFFILKIVVLGLLKFALAVALLLGIVFSLKYVFK
ncbi:hypothetical protein A0257_19055 [Hymenobacter psoromatis]|nr:hypothetical protein A0257_19055 [Hymenobacter psoromatis]